MARFMGMAVGLAGLVWSAAPAAADTVAEVQNKLNEAYKKVKSYSAKTKLTQNYEMAETAMSGELTGSIIWMRKGEKILSRIEQKGTMVQKMAGTETKSETSSLTISDGDFFYTLGEYNGQKMATKQNITAVATQDVANIIDTMGKDHKLQILPDEKVAGAECFVLEAVPNDLENAPYASLLNYYRKKDAIPVKSVSKAKDGKVVHAYELTDIKVDTDIPADQFKFTVPDGVQLMDMTKGNDMGAGEKKKEGK